MPLNDLAGFVGNILMTVQGFCCCFYWFVACKTVIWSQDVAPTSLCFKTEVTILQIWVNIIFACVQEVPI